MPSPWMQYRADGENFGRNVSALNVAKAKWTSRKFKEGGKVIRGKISYHGVDKVRGDEEWEELAAYKQPRSSSLCPPQCKPGCWMCFRKAENLRETYTFLTETRGNERPLPEPTIVDRYGRDINSRSFSAGEFRLSDYQAVPSPFTPAESTASGGGARLRDDALRQGQWPPEVPGSAGSDHQLRSRVSSAILGQTPTGGF